MIMCCNNNLGENIPGTVLRCSSCGATITCKVGIALWDYQFNAPIVLSSLPTPVRVTSAPTVVSR